MKQVGLAWRMVAWLIAIGWIPVAAEVLLNGLFHIEERFYGVAILVIPYMEFITLPLTFLALLIVLYRAAKAMIVSMRHDKKPN